MASSSRGRFPPKFNGMIWNTGGDMRAWGTQHWFANLSCYYEAIPAANRPELLDPVFDMYGGAYESWSRAAREQWGSQGIYIPETAFFDGLAPLPPEIASEMRDLYLLRKPWSERSARFMEYAAARLPFSSRWNWIRGGRWADARWTIEERGAGPFGAVTHILGTTAKVAYLFWRRYEYTLDLEFLRTRAYPMMKGAAEFYRNFPTLRRGEDGKYHIHHVNSNESVYGARDTDEDLSAMRGILPAAIRASEILDVDPDLRSVWRELLSNLAPLPTSDDPDALRSADYSGPRVIVRGLKPAVRGEGLRLGRQQPSHLVLRSVQPGVRRRRAARAVSRDVRRHHDPAGRGTGDARRRPVEGRDRGGDTRPRGCRSLPDPEPDAHPGGGTPRRLQAGRTARQPLEPP